VRNLLGSRKMLLDACFLFDECEVGVIDSSYDICEMERVSRVGIGVVSYTE
jgi:hypothetical protein